MKPPRTLWLGIVVAIVWNPDRYLRYILWCAWINAVLQFTPESNEPWRFYLSTAIIVANGCWLLAFLRRTRRRSAAYKIYDRQVRHWLTEMERLKDEMKQAEFTGAPFGRRLELSARFEEASARFDREQTIFNKAVQ